MNNLTAAISCDTLRERISSWQQWVQSGDYTHVRRFIRYYTHAHTHARTHARTHTFNGPFSGTTQVSRYEKGQTNLDFTGARDSEWQWHQLGHMQVCTFLQTDNHTSTPPLCF